MKPVAFEVGESSPFQKATAPTILVDGVRPAAVDKSRAALYIGCEKLVERMLWAARHCPSDPWIIIAYNHEGLPKARTLIDARSLEKAYSRLLNGEKPPIIGRVRSSFIQ